MVMGKYIDNVSEMIYSIVTDMESELRAVRKLQYGISHLCCGQGAW